MRANIERGAQGLGVGGGGGHSDMAGIVAQWSRHLSGMAKVLGSNLISNSEY